MIESLLKNGVAHTPWPVRLTDGSELSGKLGVNEICKTKCIDHSCAHEYGSLIGTRCRFGLTVYEGRINDARVQVFGVVGPQHRAELPTHSDFKLACKGRSVTAQEFSSWLESTKSFAKIIDIKIKEDLVKSLEPMHDAMRLARDVAQLAEQELNERYPAVIDIFSKATENQKALVKTSAMLVDTFDLLEIYLNPLAATFGQVKSVEIYKLIDKLSKIASLARKTEQRPNVRLHGTSHNKFDVYESFKLIPLILIDNAQKYSRVSGSVDISFHPSPTALEVTVSSEGALLSKSEINRIFERGFRGEAAKKAHPSGMGLGLYIAQLVASAHGFKISVQSTAKNYDLGGIPQGINMFNFVVRNVIKPRNRK